MGRKSRRKRIHKGRGKGSKPNNVYFERKTPGRDSWYAAVPDIGKAGVNTPSELKLVAAAQLADLVDLKTIDNTGKTSGKRGSTIKWTPGLWAGRSKVLWKLWFKLKKPKNVKKTITTVQSQGFKIMKIRNKEQRTKKIFNILTKELGLTKQQAKEIIMKTNPNDKQIEKLLEKL